MYGLKLSLLGVVQNGILDQNEKRPMVADQSSCCVGGLFPLLKFRHEQPPQIICNSSPFVSTSPYGLFVSVSEMYKHWKRG